MRCNGAGLASFHEWTVNRRSPVIGDVLAVSRRARAQSRSDGARNRNRNQP